MDVFNNEIEHEGIYEPLLAYQNHYRDLHHQNATSYFEALVKQSNVDVELNKEINNQIDNITLRKKEIHKRIKKKSSLISFLVFLCFAAAISIIYGIYEARENSFYLLSIVLIVLGITALVLLIVFISKERSKLKVLKFSMETQRLEIKELINEAWKQLNDLNTLLTPDICTILFRKTIPLINLDIMFDQGVMTI